MTPELLEHALLLLAREQGGDDAVAKVASEALQRWRIADKAHERAYQAALCAWNGSDANGLQDVIAIPPAQARRKRQATRRGVITALGLAGLAMMGRRWTPGSDGTLRVISTARGEVRTIRLGDGTRMDVGAMTTLRVAQTAHTRQIFLVTGDTRLSVTKDALRPFQLTTLFGQVTVIGTVFSVSVTPVAMSVAVNEGKVGVLADNRAMFTHRRALGRPIRTETNQAVILTQGQAVDVDQTGVREVSRVAADSVGAWRDGWLIFDHDDLLTAIARWNRYAKDNIRIREGDRNGLRGLRITGSFRFADETALLKSLPSVLPLKITTQGGLFWIARR